MTHNPTPQENLLTATQRLTSSYYDVKEIRDDVTGKTVTANLKRDGLLKQLRAAIIGGIGAHEGSTPGRERIPLDTGALELYDSIEREISSRWSTVSGKATYLELETTLTNWFLVVMQKWERKEITDDHFDRILRTVEKWGGSIESYFIPNRTLELTVLERQSTGKHRRIPAQCPSCQESFAYHPVSGDRVFALILTYREMGSETIQTVQAMCRFCGTVWVGGSGARELAYAMEQFEVQLNAVN